MSQPADASQPEFTAPTGAALATAFDGRLEPSRTPLLYRLAIVLVFAMMVCLPVIYFGLVAATAWGVAWYATHATALFKLTHGRGVLLAGVLYVAPIIAGGALVLFMLLPLFWRSQRGPKPLWVDRREQPLLYAYIDKLCDAMRAPRPARIDVLADANASAHIDNGLLGLLSPRLVLTIGLPLVEAMSLREFTGVIAHELGHFSQGLYMRLSYAANRINSWFFRLAYEPNGLDEALDGMLGDDPPWPIVLIGLLCRLVLGITRLLLKLMALLSHALSMHLSRQAEFDADRQAARIVGGQAMGRSLEATPFIAAANSLALDRARAGWARRALPDDVVLLTQGYTRAMPGNVKDALTARILEQETHWSDTHPPLFKRIAALRKAGLAGVLRLDARSECLFRDYDELRKMATLSLYHAVLGPALKPEHLVPFALPEPTGSR